MELLLIEYGKQIGLFLLIFALVFGILTKTQIFKNKKIDVLIALIIGLMSLTFNLSSGCVPELMKALVIALVVILIIYLISGIFLDLTKKWTQYAIGGIAVITFLIVFFSSEVCVSKGILLVLKDIWPWILGILIFLIIIGVVIKSSSTVDPPTGPTGTPPADLDIY